MTLRFYIFLFDFFLFFYISCFGYDTKCSGGPFLAVTWDNPHSGWCLNTQKKLSLVKHAESQITCQENVYVQSEPKFTIQGLVLLRFDCIL